MDDEIGSCPPRAATFLPDFGQEAAPLGGLRVRQDLCRVGARQTDTADSCPENSGLYWCCGTARTCRTARPPRPSSGGTSPACGSSRLSFSETVLQRGC